MLKMIERIAKRYSIAILLLFIIYVYKKKTKNIFKKVLTISPYGDIVNTFFENFIAYGDKCDII